MEKLGIHEFNYLEGINTYFILKQGVKSDFRPVNDTLERKIRQTQEMSRK